MFQQRHQNSKFEKICPTNLPIFELLQRAKQIPFDSRTSNARKRRSWGQFPSQLLLLNPTGNCWKSLERYKVVLTKNHVLCQGFFYPVFKLLLGAMIYDFLMLSIVFIYQNRCWCSWKLFTQTFTQNKTLVGEKKVVRHLKLWMSCLEFNGSHFFQNQKESATKNESAPCPHPWQSHWPWHSTTQDQ